VKIDSRSFKGLSRFLAPSAGGPLADRALSEKLITDEQLEICIREQDQTGRPLDEILVEKGYLKVEEVTRLRQPPLPPEVVEAAGDPMRHMRHYVLVSLLGTGGMAAVWKAWDRSLGRWVAVKILKPDIGHPTQRIEREGRMAGGLSHPNIISIYERGQHEGQPYLVMPFVDGKSPQCPLPPAEAARLTRDVAQALAHAHEMGVIHRDVKPGNILVESGGRVVLTDFGLAIPENSASARWAMSGTPEYASPEQVRGEALDSRTDIYSLGATLYQFLTGRAPFSGRDPDAIAAQVISAEPPPIEGVPAALVTTVRRAMARERDGRYASMKEFDADLAKYLERPARPAFLRPAAMALAIVLSSALTYTALTWLRGAEELERRVLADAQVALARAEEAFQSRDRMTPEAKAAALQAQKLFLMVLARPGGGHEEASEGLARAYDLMGEDAAAEGAYLRAGDRKGARLGLGRAWLRRHVGGDASQDWPAKAAGVLRSFRGEGAGPGPAFLAFAEKRWEDVLRIGPLAAESNRCDDMLHAAIGVAAGESGRWDEAAKRFDRAATLRPTDPTMWYWKGVAQAGKGDRAAAASCLKRAIAFAPAAWPLRAAAEKRISELK
jgi:tetratricopeptide (TPR) repeat protein